MKEKKAAEEVPEEPKDNQVGRLIDVFLENKNLVGTIIGIILGTATIIAFLWNMDTRIDANTNRSDRCIPFKELPLEVKAAAIFELDQANIIPPLLNKYDCEGLKEHLKRVNLTIAIKECNNDIRE